MHLAHILLRNITQRDSKFAARNLELLCVLYYIIGLNYHFIIWETLANRFVIITARITNHDNY